VKKWLESLFETSGSSLGHFEGEVQKAQDFIIVPYTILLRCPAAYYPETNVLVPIRSVAAMSNQLAHKGIVVTLHKSDHVAHSVDISSTGVSANLAIQTRASACSANTNGR
jgi:hypothetical protein